MTFRRCSGTISADNSAATYIGRIAFSSLTGLARCGLFSFWDRSLRTIAALLMLASLACGQSAVPPGVPKSQRFLSPYYVPAGLLRAKLGHGGDLLSIEVNSGTAWERISTPADFRPQCQSEDGWCLFTAAAAIPGTTQRSIVQTNQATSALYGTTWLPLNSRPVQMDSLLTVGASPWQWDSAWDCWDSVLGDTIESPLRVYRRNTADWFGITCEATFYRASGLPQFTYERWTSPYLVLDGDKILSLIIDGVDVPIAAVPLGTEANPPAMAYPQADMVILRCRCGRWLVVRGDGWDGVRYWRPHPKVLIVAGVVNNRPCVAGQPVSLWWEIEAQ